jgi:hypothetical protein
MPVSSIADLHAIPKQLHHHWTRQAIVGMAEGIHQNLLDMGANGGLVNDQQDQGAGGSFSG